MSIPDEKGSNMDHHRKVMPLRRAYPFGAQRGMKSELGAIRGMRINWHLSYTSSVRRGYVIALFKREGIFETFKKRHWPEGNADHGTMTNFYLALKDRYEKHLRGRA